MLMASILPRVHGREKGSVTVFPWSVARASLWPQGRFKAKGRCHPFDPRRSAEGGLPVDGRSEASGFVGKEWGFDPVVPIGGHVHWPRVKQRVVLATGPWPVVGPLN